MVELKNSLNKTILMVTHDPKAAARAERILHLEKGQLVRETVQGEAGRPRRTRVIGAADSAEPSRMRSRSIRLAAAFHGRLAQPGRPRPCCVRCCSWRCLYCGADALHAQEPAPQSAAQHPDGLATFVLVLVVTLVWSILAFLDQQTESQEPESQGHRHREISESQPDALCLRRHAGRRSGPQERAITASTRTQDAMAWSFYVGTLDPAKQDARQHRLLLRDGAAQAHRRSTPTASTSR